MRKREEEEDDDEEEVEKSRLGPGPSISTGNYLKPRYRPPVKRSIPQLYKQLTTA